MTFCKSIQFSTLIQIVTLKFFIEMTWKQHQPVFAQWDGANRPVRFFVLARDVSYTVQCSLIVLRPTECYY